MKALSTAAAEIGTRVPVNSFRPALQVGSGNSGYLAYAASNATSPVPTITHVVAGLNTALSVTVAGNDITVNVATDGAGAATSTAAQVVAAIQANGTANGLVTVSQYFFGGDGTGVVAAQAKTALGPIYVLYNIEVGALTAGDILLYTLRALDEVGITAHLNSQLLILTQP